MIFLASLMGLFALARPDSPSKLIGLMFSDSARLGGVFLRHSTSRCEETLWPKPFNEAKHTDAPDNKKPAEAGFLFVEFRSLTAHAAESKHRHQTGQEDHRPFAEGWNCLGCRSTNLTGRCQIRGQIISKNWKIRR